MFDENGKLIIGNNINKKSREDTDKLGEEKINKILNKNIKKSTKDLLNEVKNLNKSDKLVYSYIKLINQEYFKSTRCYDLFR
jgi:hypothetical protein